MVKAKFVLVVSDHPWAQWPCEKICLFQTPSQLVRMVVGRKVRVGIRTELLRRMVK